ncbi:hypothetical protein AB6A40_002557 [Gnathostoma spinigerum]|uniref:SWI/SNF-related matrix-associated actin-dependent regulator of chromatin subfamily A-like protein 1 n=1 Tax=Gnathostoma spinigerum TaxID=75299 RepID=A0ABD6E6W9_9BILA
MLTEEQRARIARNKAEAQRRAAIRIEREKRDQTSVTLPRIPSVSLTASEYVRSCPPSTSTHIFPSSVADKPSPKFPDPQVFRPSSDISRIPKSSTESTNATVTHGPLTIISKVSDERSEETANRDISVTISIKDKNCVNVSFHPFSSRFVDLLKSIPSRKYDPSTRLWSISFLDLEQFEQEVKKLKDLHVSLDSIPANVAKLFINSNETSKSIKYKIDDGAIDESLVSALLPYQRKGVLYGIERRGRLLLADEMGLGKSIQALGIARYFKVDWPLLIVCPSSVKFAWRNEIQRFLPAVANIIVIEKGSEILPVERSSKTAVIMSYDLMVTKRAELLEYVFHIIIFDESHLIKDCQAQRTKVATEIARKAQRTILLSGTPALSRPAELYSQIRIVDPKIFPNFRDFAIRYCDGRQGRFAFEAKGCTNSDELGWILTNSVMIRRLKKDVLHDIPIKKQEVIFLTDSAISANISSLRNAKNAYAAAKDSETRHACLVEWYAETGFAKAQSVAKHILDSFFYEGAPKRKLLVFAHHQVMLDSLAMVMIKKGIRSIRIDGSTPSRHREEQCKLFQENENIVVAILSLTAAGVGITLTAATVVVFAELHWNPGTLKQAEDRAHRVGQTADVCVQYLVAQGTADDVMWPLIQKKMDVLGSFNLSSDTFKGIDNVHKNMVSNVAANSVVNYFPPTKRSKMREPLGNVDSGY